MNDDNAHLPIAFDDNKFTLSKEALNNHILSNFKELREALVAQNDVTNKKLAAVVAAAAASSAAIAALALSGSMLCHIGAALATIFLILHIRSVLDWLSPPPPKPTTVPAYSWNSRNDDKNDDGRNRDLNDRRITA